MRIRICAHPAASEATCAENNIPRSQLAAAGKGSDLQFPLWRRRDAVQSDGAGGFKFQGGTDERITEVAVMKYFGKLGRFAMIGYAVCDVNPVVATSGVNRMSQ